MAQSDVSVTAGSGTRMRTATKTISAQTRHEQYHHLAEPDEPAYTVSRVVAASVATANDHLMQIMAGGTLNVFVRRIRLYQSALATTAAIGALQVFRLSSAGTGGTALTPAPYDSTDSASGATAMMIPTAKGTETTLLWSGSVGYIQTVPTAGPLPKLMDEKFGGPADGLKTMRIPAGTSNGIALKSSTAIAAGSVLVVIDLTEASY